MGEGDSSFGEGMSELRGGNEARERQELLRMQQAGQQQQSRRQSAGERARAMQEHAANLKKKADQVRKLRNLRYLRCLGCCTGSCSVWLTILISIIVIFSALGYITAIIDKTKGAVSAAATYVVEDIKKGYEMDKNRMTDLMCWVTGKCDYDPNAK